MFHSLLGSLLDQVERDRRQAEASRPAARIGVFGFLDVAFERITLVLASMEVLASIESPAAVLRALVQIDMGTLIGGEAEGLLGWREVPKTATEITGCENTGWIYYKPDGGRAFASVHVKRNDKEQRLHLERLRRLRSRQRAIATCRD